MTTLILHLDDGKDVTETFEVTPELFAAIQDPEIQTAFALASSTNPLIKYFTAAVDERMGSHGNT